MRFSFRPSSPWNIKQILSPVCTLISMTQFHITIPIAILIHYGISLWFWFGPCWGLFSCVICIGINLSFALLLLLPTSRCCTVLLCLALLVLQVLHSFCFKVNDPACQWIQQIPWSSSKNPAYLLLWPHVFRGHMSMRGGEGKRTSTMYRWYA